MADITDDRHVRHGPHVIDRDNILIARGADEDACLFHRLFKRLHFKTVHGRLQRTDRVSFPHNDPGAGPLEAGRRALAHIAIASHISHLAGHHHVSAATNAVYKALFTAIFVVEFRLGHAVIDVDRRKRQLARFFHLVEP